MCIFASNGSYLGELPAEERYLERQRFFRVGECIRLMYNTLRLSGEHDELNYLMRICFLRMRYILFESFSEQFAGATSSSSLMAEAQGKTEDGDGKAASAVANEEEKGGIRKEGAIKQIKRISESRNQRKLSSPMRLSANRFTAINQHTLERRQKMND